MKSTILTFGLVLFTLIAFAQPRHMHRAKGKMKTQNTELFQALQEYHKTTVYPVMKEKQKAFDKSLQRKQRKELKKLRKEAQQLKEEGKALKLKMKAEYDAGKDKSELKEQYGSEIQQQKIEYTKLQDKTLVWITTNENEVNSVMEELKPLHKEWRKEKKAIVQQYRPKDENTDDAKKPQHRKGKKGEGKHHGKRNGKKHDKKGKHGKHANREDMAKVKFVLWDGELPEATEKTITEKSVKATPKQTIDMTVFPNPATDLTTVKYDLSTNAKKVEIVLTNLSGQVVKKMKYNDLSKGTQEIRIDISNLEKGQYFYTIIADGVKTTEKVIVE
ncbi:MAG: T9SS type A sorting domain-containing protein [Saprospiraceae bacterium]